LKCARRSEISSHVGAAPAQTRLALAATCPMPTALSSRVVHHEYSRVDLINPLCILALAAFSVLFIYSAQAYVGGSQWKGQIAWFAIGGCAYWAVAAIDYKIFLKYSHWLWLMATVMLAMVI